MEMLFIPQSEFALLFTIQKCSTELMTNPDMCELISKYAGYLRVTCYADMPLKSPHAIQTVKSACAPNGLMSHDVLDLQIVGSSLLRRSKALVLFVRLVPVAVLLRLQLFAQLLQDGLEQLLPPNLVVGVTIPYGDLNSVPADRIRNATNIVVERCLMLVDPATAHRDPIEYLQARFVSTAP